MSATNASPGAPARAARAWILALPLLAAMGLGCPSNDDPPLPVDAAVDLGADIGVDVSPDLPGNLPPENAVFVSPVGIDSKDCGATAEDPCQTINKGIERAAAYLPPRPVVVAGGTYLETVRLASGVQLLGGYNADFRKGGPGNVKAVIKGVVEEGRAIGLRAENLPDETIVDTFEIEAPAASGPGESSYGVYVNNAPQLQLLNCAITAGDAVDGVAGSGTTSAAPSGNPGTAGGDGDNWNLLQPEPILCEQENPKTNGGSGGEAVVHNGAVCKGAGGAGGYGGLDSCGGANGGTGGGTAGVAVTLCDATTPGRAGHGGAGGTINPDTCVADPAGAGGAAGCDGKNGTPGADGAAGAPTTAGGFWAPTAGEDGGDGINDSTGGGGGGGGGGGDCSALKCFGKCIADIAGGGGGGGSAGCAGAGGSGGTSGGGSFGVFIVVGSGMMIVRGCTITTGAGGSGGAGGAGQPGGSGGSGGPGGLAFQDGGAGGEGGKGGDGGRGGHGGGGAGGPSVGIYVANGTVPLVEATTFSLGQAGDGGASAGNPGPDGIQQDVGP